MFVYGNKKNDFILTYRKLNEKKNDVTEISFVSQPLSSFCDFTVLLSSLSSSVDMSEVCTELSDSSSSSSSSDW
jgi:hypothetical protein